MSEMAEKTAKTRVHRAKVEVEIEGVVYRFGMRQDGVHVRRKCSRKSFVVKFSDLLTLAQGQLLFGMTEVIASGKEEAKAELKGCEPDARGIVQHTFKEEISKAGSRWVCCWCGKVLKTSGQVKLLEGA
jgi:hypothetical protein